MPLILALRSKGKLISEFKVRTASARQGLYNETEENPVKTVTSVGEEEENLEPLYIMNGR